MVVRAEKITYVREDLDISKSPRTYNGEIICVSAENLMRAANTLSAITDQHLRIGITHGVSHCYYYRGGVRAYVYGPEPYDIRHIKIQYGGILPLLEMLYALDLPVPKTEQSLYI